MLLPSLAEAQTSAAIEEPSILTGLLWTLLPIVLVAVFVNSQAIAVLPETGSALTGLQWQRFRTNFTASSNATTISFTDTAATAAGTHIDNVVLTRLPLDRNNSAVAGVSRCGGGIAARQLRSRGV